MALKMKNNKNKWIGVLLYVVGFIGYITFLEFLNTVGGDECWWYGIGISVSIIFVISGMFLMDYF